MWLFSLLNTYCFTIFIIHSTHFCLYCIKVPFYKHCNNTLHLELYIYTVNLWYKWCSIFSLLIADDTDFNTLFMLRFTVMQRHSSHLKEKSSSILNKRLKVVIIELHHLMVLFLFPHHWDFSWLILAYSAGSPVKTFNPG